MSFVTREQFLKKAARRYVEATIEGVIYRFQSLTEKEKSAYEMAVATKKGEPNLDRLVDARRRVLVLSLVDDSGTRLLTDLDVEQMGELDGKLLAQLYDVAREHCGFAQGDIETLVKNSETTHADSSP